MNHKNTFKCHGVKLDLRKFNSKENTAFFKELYDHHISVLRWNKLQSICTVFSDRPTYWRLLINPRPTPKVLSLCSCSFKVKDPDKSLTLSEIHVFMDDARGGRMEERHPNSYWPWSRHRIGTASFLLCLSFYVGDSWI